MYIDLHCHTTASDGKLTPTELVRLAKKLGFSYLAKTDHDNVDLMEEFLEAGKKYHINTIPGIEISSRFKNKSLHIVGLGIDHTNKKLLAYSKQCKIARRQRGLAMVKKLSTLGWKINKKELNKDLLARPHVALSVLTHPDNKTGLIEEFGKIPNFHDFITTYLIHDTPAFVPKTFAITAKDALQLIKQAGGISIIAHPFTETKEFGYSVDYLKNIVKLNFDGIEIYYREHSLAQIKQLKSLAKKHNLLMSAGSDFHGQDKEYPLGICNNGKYAKVELCQDLINKILS